MKLDYSQKPNLSSSSSLPLTKIFDGLSLDPYSFIVHAQLKVRREVDKDLQILQIILLIFDGLQLDQNPFIAHTWLIQQKHWRLIQSISKGILIIVQWIHNPQQLDQYLLAILFSQNLPHQFLQNKNIILKPRSLWDRPIHVGCATLYTVHLRLLL